MTSTSRPSIQVFYGAFWAKSDLPYDLTEGAKEDFQKINENGFEILNFQHLGVRPSNVIKGTVWVDYVITYRGG